MGGLAVKTRRVNVRASTWRKFPVSRSSCRAGAESSHWKIVLLSRRRLSDAANSRGQIPPGIGAAQGLQAKQCAFY
jgi:hypothetical protein